MRKRWSLKGQNSGASLVAVLAAIAFVGIIGLVITQITITNIQMKEMEQQGKKNFYNAEKVLDDLVAGLNAKAAGAMQEAYTDMLAQYRTVTSGGGNVQQTFSRLYMDNLIALFQAAPEGANTPKQRKESEDADAKVTYEVGYYSVNTVKNSFTTKETPAPGATPAPTDRYLYEDCLKTVSATGFTDSAEFYHANYEDGTFVLEGIKITAKDEKTGYVTTIQTDVVFSTPELDFENNNMVKEFMRYSLIADHAINVNAADVTVDGNAYAGDGGIYGDSAASNGKFKGNIIVTRGDICVASGAKLTVGRDDLSSEIYAENVKTKSPFGSTAESQLTLQGDSYISDDLEMDGRKSTVTLKGRYYGYNYRKHYGPSGGDVKASQYSSAIIINGRESKLDMTHLGTLMIAGRTYLARNAGSADVALGESLSVRTNQMAYYIPEAFLDMTDPDNVVFKDASGSAVSGYLGVANIYSYVNSGKPVTAYHYNSPTGGTDTVYYLAFSSEQNANDFFAEFYAGNRDQVNTYANNYLTGEAIKIDFGSDDFYYTLKGDVMYRDGAGTQDLKRVVIDNSGWAENGAYFEWAAGHAVTYKSLQTYLEVSHQGIQRDEIRFGDTNDKTQDKLLNNLVDLGLLRAAVASETGKTKVIDVSRNGQRYEVVLIDNAGSAPYVVPTEVKGGLILATGDVAVFSGTAVAGSQYSGLIISGGDITFANNAGVEANEALVSQIFADDVRGTTSQFAYLFRGYSVGDSSMGEVSIDRYMTFDNWTKTVETD